jgi:HK97 family phage major capsid protein
MTRIEELTQKRDDLRGKLKTLFQAHPNLDFSTEDRATIEGANKELEPIVKELEELTQISKLRDDILATAAGTDALKGGALPLAEVNPATGKPFTESEISDFASKFASNEFERQMSQRGGGLENPLISRAMAKGFMESPTFKKFNKFEAKPDKAPTSELEIKALLDTTGFVPAVTRSGLLISLPLRRLVVADLFPQGAIAQNRFVYMEETSETDAAAPVAEAGQKPESAMAFAEASAAVRKIATVLPVTDELFEDAPAMQAYIQGRLITFLQLAEENQLLNGDGVAPNLLGILANPGIQTQAKGTDTAPDAIYKAATKIQTVAFLDASAIVMNPTDWQNIRLLKDANGQYLFGSPLAGDVERLFGYTVVKTAAIAAGTSLVGSFDLGGMIFRRTGIAFAVSTEHADFFIFNKLMLRVEERLAFPVFRPQAFCTVTGL